MKIYFIKQNKQYLTEYKQIDPYRNYRNPVTNPEFDCTFMVEPSIGCCFFSFGQAQDIKKKLADKRELRIVSWRGDRAIRFLLEQLVRKTNAHSVSMRYANSPFARRC